jgi:hypothetical protein
VLDQATRGGSLARAAVLGAIVWSVVGVGVATLVCGLALSVWALLIVPRAVGPAVVLGALHGVWVHAERNRGAWSRHPERAGALSGLVVGILGFLPVFSTRDPRPVPWAEVAVFAAAALLGGACAGAVVSNLMRRAPVGTVPSFSARRLLVPGLVWLGLASAELVVFGPRAAYHVPPTGLTDAAVVGLPAGTARGAARSGQYVITMHALDLTGGSGGTASVAQQEGRLSMTWSSHVYEGGIDADGRFRMGARRQSPGSASVERTLVSGRFLSDTLFEIEVRSQATPVVTPVRSGATPPAAAEGWIQVWHGYGHRDTPLHAVPGLGVTRPSHD